MKKFILLIILVLISTQNSFAINSSPSEMQYKKKKALEWYNSDSPFHGQNAPKEIAFLKAKALRWYGSYASKPTNTNETNNLKKRSFRWYATNSK